MRILFLFLTHWALVVQRISWPASFILVVTKAGSDCQHPLEEATAEAHEEE